MLIIAQQHGHYKWLLSYQAPASSLTISSTGQVIMPNGYSTSDERIKSNIKTIENALEKTLLLRGVEYNNFKIEPDKKCLGLIAQEVELIIPEVVSVNEVDNIKCISYTSLVGVLIEAIKQQQQQINELKSILKNNNLS
jgi:Chaperone of endosialidase